MTLDSQDYDKTSSAVSSMQLETQNPQLADWGSLLHKLADKNRCQTTSYDREGGSRDRLTENKKMGTMFKCSIKGIRFFLGWMIGKMATKRWVKSEENMDKSTCCPLISHSLNEMEEEEGWRRYRRRESWKRKTRVEEKIQNAHFHWRWQSLEWRVKNGGGCGAGLKIALEVKQGAMDSCQWIQPKTKKNVNKTCSFAAFLPL